MTARSSGTGSSDTDVAAGEPGDLASCRIDGIDGSVEAAREQVRQQLTSDRAAPTARPDDRNRGRSEDRRHRGDVGTAVPFLDLLEIGRRRRELHRDMDDPLLERGVLFKTHLRKTLSMRRFWASVSATNVRMPIETAADARCSSRTVAMPRP